MIRKDFIEKQLEQLGLVIAKIISEITNARSNGKTDSAISISNECIKTEFDIDAAELVSVNSDQLIEYLTKNKQLNTGKINFLADLLFETTQSYEKSGNQVIAKNLYQKLIIIYDYVNEIDKTFSLNRQEKIMIIKSQL